MSVTKPKAVFFDWDGTLVDSFAFLHQAHNHVRGLLGIEPFTLEVFGGYFGQPREKLYQELYGAHNIETAKGHFEKFVLDHHLTALQPIEGAGALLDTLHGLGIPCGIVSNKKRSLIEAEVKAFGWERYFVSIVGAADAAEDKPSCAPLRLAILKSGVECKNEDIWFVGDTDNDLICAEKAGCQAILIGSDTHYQSLSQDHKIAMVQINCQALCDFVLQYT